MRTRVLNLLLAALLAVAALRLWTAQRAPVPVPAPPAAQPAASSGAGEAAGALAAEEEGAPPAEGPEAATPSPAAEGYDVIVARDLFSAARGVVPPAPPPAAKPAAKPPVQPKLTLSGVVILDGERTAYLHEGAAEARPRRVREGDSFAGGTVKSIRPDGITFVFGGSEVAVPLRTPKDTGPAPPPAAAAGVPVPPDAVTRRAVQPPGGDTAGQLRRPPQAVPGVGRLLPPPDEEPVYEDDTLIEDDGMLLDDADQFDEGDIPPEDFEEAVE